MEPVEKFAALAAAPDPPLDRAVLAIAAGADPTLDVDRWLAELDRLADGLRSVDDLVHRLIVDEGFRGNTKDYYDPRNSLLPHVLRRKLGIPITLAVVGIEVGRRAGLRLRGIGMPGHFLLRVADEGTYLDLFDGGAVLDVAVCEARFRAATGSAARFGPQLLPVVPTSAILVRMLENLRGAFASRQDPGGLEWTLRMRMALPGTGTDDLVQLANAVGTQGRWDEAARMLDRHAGMARPEIAARLRLAARSMLAHLN